MYFFFVFFCIISNVTNPRTGHVISVKSIYLNKYIIRKKKKDKKRVSEKYSWKPELFGSD